MEVKSRCVFFVLDHTGMSQEASKWLVNGSQLTCKLGYIGDITHFTNHLLTSWDIQVQYIMCAISKTRIYSANLESKAQDAKWAHTNGNTTRTHSWQVCSPAWPRDKPAGSIIRLIAAIQWIFQSHNTYETIIPIAVVIP